MTTPTKIAILDDYANIAPAYFQHLKDGVEIVYFPETLNPKLPSDLEQLVARLQPFHVISTMRERTPFSEELLTRLPNLKLLLTTGLRNRGLDVEACKKLGVTVVGTARRPDAVADFSDTNEQNWALLLGLAKNLAEDDTRLKTEPRGWQNGTVFGLAGKTLALLGLGNLGLQSAVTGMLGFGMKVIAWSPNLTQARADKAVTGRGMPTGSVSVVSSKEDLLRQADVLSVHIVLSDRTRGIIGKQELALMKKTALLINTSRGPIIDEDALLDTLREGQIRGAALDVFDTEPLPPDSPWRSQDWGKDGRSHVLLSPHAGYIEEKTLNWMYKETAENLDRWLSGQEVVNKLE